MIIMIWVEKAGLIALEILQDDKDVSEFEISTMSSFEKIC